MGFCWDYYSSAAAACQLYAEKPPFYTKRGGKIRPSPSIDTNIRHRVNRRLAAHPDPVTPGGEIDLCGHATLATACAIMTFVEKGLTEVTFSTLSGDLTVTKRGELYEMNFPAYELKPVPVTEDMIEAMGGAVPEKAFMGRDLLCVFGDEETVRRMTVDQEKVRGLEGLLLHVTAAGKNTDCVSRSFAPKCNVAEDPVCGSGHCHIVPYWTKTLGKDTVVAYQASRRGGTLYCTQAGDPPQMVLLPLPHGERRFGEVVLQRDLHHGVLRQPRVHHAHRRRIPRKHMLRKGIYHILTHDFSSSLLRPALHRSAQRRKILVKWHQ